MAPDSTHSGSNYGMASNGPGTDTTAGSTTGLNPGSGQGSGQGSGTTAGASDGMTNGIRNSDGYLTALFPDRDSAERAYQGVVDRGYTSDDINLVMSDETRKRHFSNDSALAGHETELGTKAAEGAGIGVGIGAGIGGTLGAIAGVVAAVGTSIAIPGLGLVIAGPLAEGLAGAGWGGVAGGLMGALVGVNMPEERVKEYQDGINNGGILLGMRPTRDDHAAELEQHWRDANGRSVSC
jgi:hypothetical protein